MASYRRSEPADRIFHIATVADWEGALAAGEYRVSTRDRLLADVAFIHCSHRHQVEGVARAFYGGAGALVLLEIDLSRLEAEVREESAGGSETFPHVYGAIPVDAVVAVDPLEIPPGRGLPTG